MTNLRRRVQRGGDPRAWTGWVNSERVAAREKSRPWTSCFEFAAVFFFWIFIFILIGRLRFFFGGKFSRFSRSLCGRDCSSGLFKLPLFTLDDGNFFLFLTELVELHRKSSVSWFDFSAKKGAKFKSNRSGVANNLNLVAPPTEFI